MPSPVLLRVLVVDDQESMRWIVQNHLKSLNITRVTQASSAEDALTRLSESKFDLIISDFNMGAGSGLDLLKAVRANPMTRKMPFIMLTGNAEGEVVNAVVKAGVNNYIVKPVSLDVLRKRIEQVLGPLR